MKLSILAVSPEMDPGHTLSCHEAEIGGEESPDVCSPLEKKGQFSLPHFITDLETNPKDQKVIFDGKAFFYGEHNFPHCFSKPKVINRVIATGLQNISSCRQRKKSCWLELLALCEGSTRIL